MNVLDVITLAGGFGFFLYGMNIMGSGLEKLAGSKLEVILRRVTSNPLIAVLFGAVLTAAIQSSSATTVIVVGLVNSGIMKLNQAIGIIMGANIGTTVTSQIISLTGLESDNVFLSLIKPDALAPLVAVVGAILFVFIKGAKAHNIGQTMLGFGILFAGMFAMSDAVKPLRESELFLELFSTLSNPILGVLAGAAVTAIIQSSSASVGILQALTVTGAITWSTAVPIILGQNIGTCVTPMIASIGASKSAKRSAFVHLYFNIIGTALFIMIIYASKALFANGAGIIGQFFTQWEQPIDMSNIANFHTTFNVVVTFLFLPFTKLLAKLAEWTIKQTKVEAEKDEEIAIPILDERLLASPTVALQQARNAVETMAERAQKNHDKSFEALLKHDLETIKKIDAVESTIDKLEVSVSNYLLQINECELNDIDSHIVSELLNFVTEFERIGDYVINIVERSGEIYDKNIQFSESAVSELRILNGAISEIIDYTTQSFIKSDVDIALKVEPLEETIDAICEELRDKHITRLKSGSCNIEGGIVFLEILTNWERIGDHCSNVVTRIISNKYIGALDPHNLRNDLHNGKFDGYEEMHKAYNEKYLVPIKNTQI